VRRRFRKEAHALSRPSHPHIATVHDFDTQEGVDFLVMELIPGQGLDERLRSGPLPEKEVLRLGVQLARGLMAAHEHGVVHRDLKPSNIRLTEDGLLKILDFGLAHVDTAEWERSGPTATAEPAFAGTVPYMAPEQIRGTGIDARTDIYAAGNVLHEMATGERPFATAHGAMVTEAILHQAPASPRQIQPALSSGLEFVILKALEKDPEWRYQSAKELLLDLERLATPSVVTSAPERQPRRRWPMLAAAATVIALAVGGVAAWMLLRMTREAPIASLAVLPLKNFSGDPGQEFFVDGMTDALIAGLAQIKALKVISRTSVMQYKEAKKPLPEIAGELGVDGIVEGSVTRSGERVRITAQLIDARQDRHLWASSYEREMTDVLALQSEVVRAIAGEIRAQVTPQERSRLGKARSVDPVVYDATLKGRAAVEYATREAEFRQAIQLFQSAVDRDPSYAPAWAGLAEATRDLAAVGWELVAPAEVRDEATAAADRALALDETLPEAHNARAVIARDELDLASAQLHFERALELRPGYPACRNLYGQVLTISSRFEEGRRQYDRARELDPFSPWNDVNAGAWWFYQGRYREALEEDQRACQRNPTLWILPWNLGSDRLALGQFREAVQDLEAALARLSDRPAAVVGPLGLAYSLAGRREEALRICDEMEQASRTRYVAPTYLALVHSGLGQMDDAFRLLDRSLEERTPSLLGVAHRHDGQAVILRRDPRWKAFLERLRRLVRLPPGVLDPFS
jgi:TolB-like protein/Flp pilus assembly protein TadD